MKVNLVVADGPHKGKEIPLKGSQFLIGRDPQCHLRPASPMISRKHCAFMIRGDKLFLKDFGSTNGVHVNDKRIEGELEIRNQDRIIIDPLHFLVRIENSKPHTAKPPAPKPHAAKGAGPKPAPDPADDESIAAMLLETQDDGTSAPGSVPDQGEIPLGTTVMQIPALTDTDTTVSVDKSAPGPKGEKKADLGNTSAAAKILLEKYTRRRK
jgi:predicted component of type VI protein secretion system